MPAGVANRTTTTKTGVWRMKAWWRLMWPALRQRRAWCVAALLLALSTLLAGVGLLAVAGWFLTATFLAAGQAMFNLFVPSALIRGLSLGRIVSRYGERIVGHIVTLDLQTDVRTSVFARLCQFSQARLARYREGELSQRLVSDVAMLDTVFLLILSPLFSAIGAGLLFSALLGQWLPQVAWAVLVCLLFAACLIPYTLARAARNSAKQLHQAETDMRALTHHAIAGFADIQVWDAKPTLDQSFEAASRRIAKARARVQGFGLAGQFCQHVMMGVALVLCAVWGAQAVATAQVSGPIWVGAILAILGLFEVVAPMMRGAARLGGVQNAADHLLELLDEPNEGGEAQAQALVVQRAPTLTLQAMYFAYAEQPVLQDINLTIAAGDKIVLTGPSGSGKSTLLQVLMRILPLTQGQYLIQGQAATHWQSASWFKTCTLLAQDSPLFMGTVRDNLLMAKPQADEVRLWQVLTQVQLAEKIRSLPQGLDTWLGEGGNQLSVGQARRLCLARTILTEAQIWFLDEPCAGLDVPTSQALLKDIMQAAQDRTVILVSHGQVPEHLFQHHWQLYDGRLQV